MRFARRWARARISTSAAADLKLAQRLLEKDARVKIYEIARQTGFSSAKQFSMAFSQEFGSSPREYQRSRSQ